MRCLAKKPIVVIKIGGSVLADHSAYGLCARFLASRLDQCAGERIVVVISAQEGLTDALERLARETVENPSPRALDLLWCTGETRSVALLTLCLQKLGIEAAGLNVHETGMRITWKRGLPRAVDVEQQNIQEALSLSSIVVVPGFFGTDKNGVIRSLGRGGSDLTAVILAEYLDACRCELVKDVPGYFTDDPRVHRSARHLPSLTFRQAIAMADAGCTLVQKEALVRACQVGLKMVVRDPYDARNTIVSENDLCVKSLGSGALAEEQIAES